MKFVAKVFLLLVTLAIISCAPKRANHAINILNYDVTKPPFTQEEYLFKQEPAPEEPPPTIPAPTLAVDLPATIEIVQGLLKAKNWHQVRLQAEKIIATDPSNNFGYASFVLSSLALHGLAISKYLALLTSNTHANEEFDFYKWVTIMPFVGENDLALFKQANNEFARPDTTTTSKQKKSLLATMFSTIPASHQNTQIFARLQLAVAAVVVKNSAFSEDGTFNYGVAADKLKDSDVLALVASLKEVSNDFAQIGETKTAASLKLFLENLAAITKKTVEINTDIYKYYGLDKDPHSSKDDRSAFLQYLTDKSHIIVSVDKIWDAGQHNAFTDMVHFKGEFIVVFREGKFHYHPADRGKVRVLASKDGKNWESLALLGEDDKDLRDPKISITPDQRLMINVGGNIFSPENEALELSSHTAFSSDGRTWEPLQRVQGVGKEWLWKVTWHKGKAWGISYGAHFSDEKAPATKLYTSDDGITYSHVTDLRSPFDDSQQNEGTIRFLEDDTAVVQMRFDGHLYIGAVMTGKPPYTNWSWHKIPHHMGGPTFQVLPNGDMWAAARSPISPNHDKLKTIIAKMTPSSYHYYVALPSDGDNSYPGMVYLNGYLYVSYYSSHELEGNEPKARIYFAKIKLPKEKK